MNSPVKTAFIIGTGRCGTSWLGQMLNSHADICVPPEIQLLFECSDNGSRMYEEFIQAGTCGLEGERLAAIIERGCPHKLEMFFDYHEFCRREDTPKRSLADFVTAFYSAIAKSRGKSWLIEQTPWYGSRLDLLSRFFPQAKVIHMVRDGRDVALSFARTPWWYVSPRLNLERWQREIKKITLDAALYLDKSCYLETRYEDLVANTESEMRRICDFLGVKFDPAMLEPQGFIDYGEFCRFDMEQVSSRAYTTWLQRKESAVFSDNVGAWRRSEELFHPPLPREITYWLSRYGYEVGSDTPIGIDTAQYQLTYSARSLESLYLTQVEKSFNTEKALEKQMEQTEAVTKDWVARGEHIERLSKAVEALERDLQLFKESWCGRLRNWLSIQGKKGK